MKSGSRMQAEAEALALEQPRWAYCFIAMAGVALLIGPTLAVLWPR